jgi:hypothetical protein
MLQKTVWGNVFALSVIFFFAAPLLAQDRARLSDSLQRHVLSKSTRAIEVIVHGTADEIAGVAARHGLRVKKRMSEGAVLLADAAQIESLSAEVDHLSRDVEVSSFMSVSNAAIGADQVQAGLAGMSAYTGAGVGVALIDSGVWTGHRSLWHRRGKWASTTNE